VVEWTDTGLDRQAFAQHVLVEMAQEMNGMETDNVLLVVCLTLFLVIGINAALYVSLRGGGTQTQIDLFRRAAQRARQPWKEEDEALHELSKRVAALKNKRIRDEE
jgi:hypothetical protein